MAVLERRLGLLFLAFAACLLAAFVRAGYLAVIKGPALRKVAVAEHVEVEAVPALRGAILDRDGQQLALSLPAERIVADPYLIKDPQAVAGALAPYLGESPQALAERLSRPTGYVVLAPALEAATAEKVLSLNLPGIEGQPVQRRVHPRGGLAAQLLGALGSEGEGLSGLELAYNAQLAGVWGRRRVVRDGLGAPISIETERPARPGEALTLTLDANIQQRTEEVLAADAAVFHPKRACALVASVETGKLLAVASWPPANLEATASLTPEALFDQPFSLNYEPGSTFKVVTIAGALEEGLVTPETTFEIPEAIEMGGHLIHDAESHPTEDLTVSQILARSSNVGAVKIAALLGPNSFYNWARRFGFGAPVGTGVPGEESGVMPPPQTYTGSSMGNLPFGQGEMVTPIQLLAAYEAIADGGIWRTPQLVERIGGRPVPPPPGRRIISTQVAEELQQMLKGPLQPGGTAAEVSIPGYELAGKTGTAELVNPETGTYSKSRFIASFVGFAPVRNPKVLALVVVDEPSSGSIYGGQVAAPAWGEIVSFALSYLGVPPSG